ncbi:MAG: hypothetical protein AAF701_03070 [Pseudomonadota bacterium]
MSYEVSYPDAHYIALVTNQPETGLGWKSALSKAGYGNLNVMTTQGALQNVFDNTTDNPQIYVTDNTDFIETLYRYDHPPVLLVAPQNGIPQNIIDFGVHIVAPQDVKQLLSDHILHVFGQADGPDTLDSVKSDMNTLRQQHVPMTAFRMHIAPQEAPWQTYDVSLVAEGQKSVWHRVRYFLPTDALIAKDSEFTYTVVLQGVAHEQGRTVAQTVLKHIQAKPLYIVGSPDPMPIRVSAKLLNLGPQPHTPKDAASEPTPPVEQTPEKPQPKAVTPTLEMDSTGEFMDRLNFAIQTNTDPSVVMHLKRRRSAKSGHPAAKTAP